MIIIESIFRQIMQRKGQNIKYKTSGSKQKIKINIDIKLDHRYWIKNVLKFRTKSDIIIIPLKTNNGIIINKT